MTVALCEKTLKKSFTIDNIKLRTAPMKAFTSVEVPKGILMNAMVNVNVDLDAAQEISQKASGVGNLFSKVFQGKKVSPEKIKQWKETHIHAYQDMMGWFIPLESGGTLLVFLMQVDLGSDIPHWAFQTAVAATAAASMRTLNKLTKERL
jgi:hypothetical protein